MPIMLMEADLSEDIQALCAMTFSEFRKLAHLVFAKRESEREIDRLQSIIDALKRHRFGRKSKNRDPN